MSRLAWSVAALALALLACDQSVDEGSHDTGAPDLLTDGGTADGTAPSDAAADVSSDAPAGPSVTVTYNGQAKVISLSQLTPVTFEGFASALLSDVVALALPSAAQDGLTADFMAADGFKPGSKSNCVGLVPVAGSELSKGYIDVSSRKLRWDLSLGYPGCLYVQDLAEIQIADK